MVSPDTEEVEVYSMENRVYQLNEKGRGFAFDFIFEDDCMATVDFNEIW